MQNSTIYVRTSPLTIGIVVIGRNEGERLQNCLKAFIDMPYPLIYVDSGSSDNSVEIAKSLGFNTHSLDPLIAPFSAARARNEGFEKLLETHPQIEFVQFLDGDCHIASQWLEAAACALQEDHQRGAVIGHLSEAFADTSLYNRLCALEWRSPPGDLVNFGGLGGISMVRAFVFKAINGFNPDVIAGEDSEFGVRLSLAGYKVTKIDYSMATHDANITRFGQWWTRAVRAGHAIGQRAHLNGATHANDCVKEQRSTWFWGVMLPLLVAISAIPTHGASLVLLLSNGILGFRVYRFRRHMGDSASDAWLYARFLLMAKVANGIGLIKFHVNKMKKHYEIIEYK